MKLTNKAQKPLGPGLPEGVWDGAERLEVERVVFLGLPPNPRGYSVQVREDGRVGRGASF
jgi:hypothetical protein